MLSRIKPKVGIFFTDFSLFEGRTVRKTKKYECQKSGHFFFFTFSGRTVRPKINDSWGLKNEYYIMTLLIETDYRWKMKIYKWYCEIHYKYHPQRLNKSHSHNLTVPRSSFPKNRPLSNPICQKPTLTNNEIYSK